MIRVDVHFEAETTRITILRVPGTRRTYCASNASLSRLLTICNSRGCRAEFIAHNHLRAIIR